jgi:integrase
VLVTSGMREGTLLKLRYRHVKEDLEGGRIPIHIHLEGGILKGNYVPDCDTFINGEAASYLKLYLDERRRGTEKIPPETVTDESFLFVVPVVDQATRTLTTKPLAESTLWGMMRRTFIRAGLTAKRGRMYEVRPHSLRKFFRTQMGALGMNPDFVEYMMGHKLSTYNDVASLGPEGLRGKYSTANLRIQPEKEASTKDLLEAIIKGQGKDPRNYLKEGIGPGMDVITPELQTEVYARAVYDMLRGDIVEDLISTPEEGFHI